MKDVKRYESGVHYCSGDAMVQSTEGDYVSYEDYAALKAERDALAAENFYLRGEIKQHSESTHFCEACGEDDPCSNDDVCYALNHALPATDEIINDFRADIIESLIAALDDSGAFTMQDAITVMESFAANPRKGNANE